MNQKLAVSLLATSLISASAVAVGPLSYAASSGPGPAGTPHDGGLILVERAGSAAPGPTDTSGEAAEQSPDILLVDTPDKVVQRMLDMGDVGPGDYVMDLGSGDGRIVIQAAQRGAYGAGVEIDPERVAQARANARKADVRDRVVVLQQDLFKTDISRATVVTTYLPSDLMRKLRPRLLEQLKPGTRVVSHVFVPGDWKPDENVVLSTDANTTHPLYMWIVPANAAGQWQWKVDGQEFTWQVEQQYQELTTTLTAGADTALAAEDVELRGRRISFSTAHDGKRYMFSGRVEDDRIDGVIQVRGQGGPRVHEWTADRHE